MDRQPVLRELGRRPLWFALIAILRTYRGRLPEDRVALFDELIELMLHRWPSWRIEESESIDEQAISRFLNAREFRGALEAMAFEIQERAGRDPERTTQAPYLDKGEFISLLAKNLIGVRGVSSEEFLKYLSEGAALLEVDDKARYRFVITAFQEFLAACHLAEQDDFKRRLDELLGPNPVHWEEVAEYLPGIIHLRHPRFGILAALNLLLPEMPHRPVRNRHSLTSPMRPGASPCIARVPCWI